MKRLLMLGICCLITTLSQAQAPVQAQTGEITGRVLDNKKQPVPEAIIALLLNTMPLDGAVADKEGNFVMKKVKPGAYSIKARQGGYHSQILPRIVVEAGKTTKVDFELISNYNRIVPAAGQAPPQQH